MVCRRGAFACASAVALLTLINRPARGADRDWLGGTSSDWNTSGNWSPAGTPVAGDNIFIGRTAATNQLVTTSGAGAAGNVTISNGLLLSIDRTFDIGGNTILSTPVTPAVELSVNAGGLLTSNTLTINAGSALSLGAGTVRTKNGMTNSGVISGFGRIEVGAGNFVNQGEISAAGGTLTFGRSAGGTGVLSLSGLVDVSGGFSSLVVDAPLSAAFVGTLNVGDRNSATFNIPWSIASTGTVNLNGGTATTPAKLLGAQVNVGGKLNAAGVAQISAPVSFDSSGVVSVASGADLQTSGGVTFNGAGISGAGQLTLLGNATVAANTTVSTGVFDVDGTATSAAGRNVIDINAGATLTVASTRIETSGSDFNGIFNVRGTLAMTGLSTWNLGPGFNRGELNMQGGTVTGGQIVNIGAISGFGTIAASNVQNNTSLSASGGQLVISTLGFPDLDGVGTETGVVNAVDGDIRITTLQGSSFLFDGTVNVGPGHEFRMDNNGLVNSGTVNLGLGTYTAPRFSQSETGKLNITVNGTGPAEHGNVNASTAIALAGTLNLTVAPNLPTTTPGFNVTLMQAPTATGNFSTVTGWDRVQKGQFIDVANDALGGTVRAIQAAPGDANFDKRVDSSDLILASPKFNQGASNAGWAEGDWDDDGDVDSRDLLLASPYYNTGSYVNTNLAGGPLRAVLPTHPKAIYNASTGQLVLDSNGYGNIASFILLSRSGRFRPEVAQLPAAGFFTTLNEGEISQLFTSGWGDGTWDLGRVLPENLALSDLLEDLSFTAGSPGRDNVQFDLSYVPEPGGVVPVLLVCALLRRKSSRRHSVTALR